jgi:hypothetical protein
MLRYTPYRFRCLPGSCGGGYPDPVKNSPFFIRFCVRFAAAFLAAVIALGTARGDSPLPAGVPDLLGARALSLGAYRGLAAGNDGIFTNAASLAARRRYSLESFWSLDRVGSDTAIQVLNASAVDSQTAGVTGGFSYTRVLSGPWSGNLFHLPIAFPVSDSLFLGATAKYQSLDGPTGDQMRALNLDASAFWQLTRLIGLGVSGYNLIDSGHRQIQPRAYGAGVSVGDDRSFHVLADWRGDEHRQGKLTNLYAVGGELLLGDTAPVRAGYMRDETRNANFWSAGIGLVTSGGFALDVGYRQRFEDPTERTIAVAIKLFLLPQ